MKIIWMPQALADLAEIRRFVARARPLTAARVSKRIRARDRKIADQPHAGRLVEAADEADEADEIREVIQERWRIVYRVLETRVHVLRVIDAARVFPPHEELGEAPAIYRTSRSDDETWTLPTFFGDGVVAGIDLDDSADLLDRMES